MKFCGKLSKKFFDYLDKYNLNINYLDTKKMLEISISTGLALNYIKVLKSRYSDKTCLGDKKLYNRLNGKLSKKFFDYLDENKLDISSLDSRKMLEISINTGLTFHYIEVLKSRYSINKKLSLTKEDVIWAINKFGTDYFNDDEDISSYDIFRDSYNPIKRRHKLVMCGYLKEKLGIDVSVELFDKIHGEIN